MLAQIQRRERPWGSCRKQDESLQQRPGTARVRQKRRPEAPLPAGSRRAADKPGRWSFAEDAVVAQAFDLDEPAIGGKADLAPAWGGLCRRLPTPKS